MKKIITTAFCILSGTAVLSAYAQTGPQTQLIGTYTVNSVSYDIYKFWGVDTATALRTLERQPWYFGTSPSINFTALAGSTQRALAGSLAPLVNVNGGTYAVASETAHVNGGITGRYFVVNNLNQPGNYSGLQIALNDADYQAGVRFWYISILPTFGATSADTVVSLESNAFALRNAFNLQSAKVAQGLTYDCTVYDQKNICVSFAGSKSDGKGFDATTGALIIAHKLTNNFRFGGYIDQSFGSDTTGGLTVKKGNPGFGAFAVWSQNADGSGVQVRAAANMGKVDIETKREAIGTAEAGEGQSNIKSQGFSLEVSKDYAINSMWTARPYVGYRQTTSKRAGYTEQSSNDVTAPLTYSSLKQTTETLTVGATFAHTLSAKTTMYLTAGIEHDLKNRISDYAATSSTIGDIDSINMSSDKTKTRPTVSFALNHDIDKTQRIGVSLTHRKEAFASGSTTSAFLQYSKGF